MRTRKSCQQGNLWRLGPGHFPFRLNCRTMNRYPKSLNMSGLIGHHHGRITKSVRTHTTSCITFCWHRSFRNACSPDCLKYLWNHNEAWSWVILNFFTGNRTIMADMITKYCGGWKLVKRCICENVIYNKDLLWSFGLSHVGTIGISKYLAHSLASYKTL